MKRSISNNKKSPVNTNNNEDEVNIDVNLLLNDPKSLHKMLNKKSDDNDYVPTNSNPNKLSNRPKKPYKGRPYYYDEGLWEGKKPAKGQQFELETVKVKTERKQERKTKEQLEKLKAMRPVKKKEETVETDVRPPLAFFKEEGSKMLKNHGSKKEEKGSELIKNYVDKEKKENVKGNVEHPLLWNERIDAYLKNRLPEEKYDNLKNRWRKEENKPRGKAADKLWEDGSYLDGTNFKNKILKYKGKNNK
jgi:hypothetical protein